MSVEQFDAVVVGSGFGGAVTTFRLAEAGLSVCLLERGKPYPPGSFPRAPHELATNFWAPRAGLYGLFDVRSFGGKLWSIAGSGLGGGSLIYAGALHRMDELWSVQDRDGRDVGRWPLSPAELEPHYDRVEHMLGAQPYPFRSGPPYDATPKTRELERAAAGLGLEWDLPKLGISFADRDDAPRVGVPIHEPANLHGTPRVTCRLCAECNLGCNYGSKNSLDLTYLSAAKKLGAEIRTLCEVRAIAPRAGGGFVVQYVDRARTTPHGEPQGADRQNCEVGARQLILAAGTFGTTELLLRNRAAFPGLSPMLGQRFSGNGNRLMFATNARDAGGRPLRLNPWHGPVITSAVHVPDRDEGMSHRGFYVEDGGYPLFLAWVLESARPSTLARLGGFALRRRWSRLLRRPAERLGRPLAGVIGSGALSSSSMPLLGIGHDLPNGVMSLQRRKLNVDWPEGASVGDQRMQETARAIAETWNAELSERPFPGLNPRVTVHPLGGCPMGRHEREGVVDAYGQVFNVPGLFVVDGSVMPGPIGANPSLTIAAFADRAADTIIDQASRDRQCGQARSPAVAGLTS